MLHDSLLIRHWLTERAVCANRSTIFDNLLHLLSTCKDRGTIRTGRLFGGRGGTAPSDAAGGVPLRETIRSGRAVRGPAFGLPISGLRRGCRLLHPEGKIRRDSPNSGKTEAPPTRRDRKSPESYGSLNFGNPWEIQCGKGTDSGSRDALGFGKVCAIG